MKEMCFNRLAPALSFPCNLQNPGYKLQNLTFFMETLTKKNKDAKGKGQKTTGLSNNGHNWP
jgi:hypothetical protein